MHYKENAQHIDTNVLVNQQLQDIRLGYDEIYFLINNEWYVNLHEQDCCEDVDIGNYPETFTPSIIRQFEVKRHTEEEIESTFYSLRTDHDDLSWDWRADLNTYYSVDVEFKTSAPPPPAAKSLIRI